MATKFSLESKFIAAGSKMKVYAHEGKNGVNVGVTIKSAGMRASTGCQACFDTAEAATARFDELVANAVSLGWAPRASTAGIATRRAAFTEIPPAPVAAETVEVVGSDAVEPGSDEVPVPADAPAEPIVKKRNGKK
jgi:hypothetical protein